MSAIVAHTIRFYMYTLAFLLVSALSTSYADTLYSEIKSLNRDDPLFKQITTDIDDYYYNSRTGGELPPLSIFSYRPKEEETIFTVAARFNLPYESIALLNSISSPADFGAVEELLIPNSPGIFIPQTPRNELEKLIVSWRKERHSEYNSIIVRTPDYGKRKFDFLRGERFHSVERSFFLHVLFHFPLPDGVMSSSYGPRTSPITHKEHFHHGIDIAAAGGTEVYASWQGRVELTGENSALGNYIVLLHPNDFRTIYGHLEKISVKRGTSVSTGSIIGSVGSTGLSTGPHLHFEIRKAGESWDPTEILR